MKVIFLDIDGVLNSVQWMIACHNSGKNMCGANVGSIDPGAVKLLNQLTDQTGAAIVVSSAWRIFGLSSVKTILKDSGVTGNIIDITPRLHEKGFVRGNEIQAWIDSQEEKPEKFVIFDDDSDMAHLMNYLVKTNMQDCGLKKEHIDRALEILDEV